MVLFFIFINIIMKRQKLKTSGPGTDRYSNFLENKTIQRSYNFIVYFEESLISDMKDIPSFVCTGIELPDYGFQKQYLDFGSFKKSFPILDHNGFEFTMKLEETENSEVKGLIQNLASRQIDNNGYYRTYKQTVIPQIVASVYTHDAWNAYKVHFTNCYFLKANSANFSYNSGDKIEYDLTFNCDHFYVHVQEEIAEANRHETTKPNAVQSHLAGNRTTGGKYSILGK